MKLTKIKLIAFDFDGTLSDSHDAAIDVFNSLADQFGYRKVHAQDLSIIREKTSREVLKYLGISYLKLPFVLRAARTRFQSKIDGLQPFEGINDVLSDLRSQNYQLGILTSNSKENVSRFLRRNDLDVFHFVYSDISVFGKTRVIKSLLRKAKVTPEEAIYVGDETRDVDAAKAAGIQVVSVTWGFNTRQILMTQKPDYILDYPAQLMELFARALVE